MSSSDEINYSVRPNKAVERRVVFAYLMQMNERLNLAAHKYLGLGSVWFVDFVLAHKLLDMRDMYSIEANAFIASRARYNIPYSCVNVIEGESQLVLPGLPLEERPLVAWLDYDTSFEGPVLTDLDELARRAPADSILITTINAHRQRLPESDTAGNPYPEFRDRLVALAGDLVDDPLPKRAAQAKGYVAYAAQLLFRRIRRTLRVSGRDLVSVPLFNLAYSDNAPMLTIGAALLSPDRANLFDGLEHRMPLPDFLNGEVQHSIAVPPLTFKEKMALDSLLPAADELTTEFVEDRAGFRMRLPQLTAYKQFYKFYPTFGEFTI